MSPVIVEDANATVSCYGARLDAAIGKTFLVTGAGGMVGGYIVHALMALGRHTAKAKPTVIAEVRDAKLAQAWLGEYAEDANFELCVCDVQDIHRHVRHSVDYIVHAASPASPSVFREHPLSVIDANVDGTRSALDLARTSGARVGLVSSMEVYGPRREPNNHEILAEHDFTDDDPLDIRSAYPQSKRMAENLCACHRAEHGTDFVIARLGHTYGPGMKLTDTRVQAQFIRGAIFGQGITMRSNGSKARAYTYIADACAGILLALLDGGSGEAYNIANNDAIVSIRQLAEIVLAQAGPSSGTLTVNMDGASTHMWSRMEAPTMLDCAAIKHLGWQPCVGIDKGISRTLRYYRDGAAV